MWHDNSVVAATAAVEQVSLLLTSCCYCCCWCVSETWIVMDLMDRGNLAASLRHSKLFVNEETGAVDMVSRNRTRVQGFAGIRL